MHNLSEIVKNLLHAMSGRDLEKLMSFYDENMIFELVPEHAEIHSKKEWRKHAIEFINWVEDGRQELLRTVQQGNTVWMERIDHWKIKGKWINLPIVSIAEFNDNGKVIKWREYHTLEYRKQFEAAPKTGFDK